jgi:pyridoxamine 5'-phosphate oxidase family protein
VRRSTTCRHSGSGGWRLSSPTAVPRVALVVDDVVSTQPWRVRFLEVRGTAEAVETAGPAADPGDASVIRIRPTRILSFGIEEPPGEPHLTKLRTRNLD